MAPPPHSAPTLAGTTTTGRVPADITGSQNIHSNMATQHILLGITAAAPPGDTATTLATKVASTDEDCPLSMIQVFPWPIGRLFITLRRNLFLQLLPKCLYKWFIGKDLANDKHHLLSLQFFM